MTQNSNNLISRPPIVVIMGHIDHGKSTLLQYIRNEAISGKLAELNEAGGITQHISAYEVEHTSKDGKKHQITFLDTPGHAAFGGIRRRGASVADIAILVVSAEDGVKPQTLEALSSIIESKTAYIVAITKIDKPGVNIDRIKQNLGENQIYIEGYGGDIPAVPVSAKTGEGVPELLEMITLVAELENLSGDPTIPGVGVVIESNRHPQKGISATCIIKNGTLEKGMYIVSGIAISPIRIMENYLGKQMEKASFSSPVKIIGWEKLPLVGDSFQAFKTREEARTQVEKEIAVQLTLKDENFEKEKGDKNKSDEVILSEAHIIPIIIKADTGSSLEAVISEIKKLKTDRVSAQVISSGIGTISESDVRLANSSKKVILLGFNTKIDAPAKHLAERNEIEVKTFDVIYKLSEWLEEQFKTLTPKMKVVESLGKAKVLKIFSKVKDRQILGGRVEKGMILVGAQIKILRRDIEIGEGKVRDLQMQKVATIEVKEGKEFGAMILSNIEIAVGDIIESSIITEI